MNRKLKYIIRRCENTVLFAIKTIMLVSLFVAFFGVYSYLIPELRVFNRTSIISYGTFVVAILLFIRIYGGFSVGEKKSKEIVNSMLLATLMADIITFLEMYIMGLSTTQIHNFADNHLNLSVIPPLQDIPMKYFLQYYFTTRVLPGLGLLVIVFVLQVLLLYIFSYFGNFVYFKINHPQKSLIVYQDESLLPTVIPKIQKYKKQWRINRLIKYDDPDIKGALLGHSTIFFLDVPKNERTRQVEYCYAHNKNIYILPDVSDIILNHASHVVVDDTAMFASTKQSMSFEQMIIKRICDIIFAVIMILLSSPFMIISALAIKIYDRGPVFYKQARLTKGGREFNVLKFRSMIVDAEKNTGAMLSTENDDRITPVGKILRRFRLDELPQLFNILKGDMSVVGPRPERLVIAKEYEKELPEFRYRLKVKAGLTGLAQIMSKYNTTPKDKLALDLEYIAQYSIWLDIKLILQTMIVFLKKDSTEGVTQQDDDINTILEEIDKGATKPSDKPK
ncbi:MULTISPECIES: sugar transferase [Clostridiaceae]|uniref:Sugar transferase n=1 Tax=Clostridium facile TaxID=2763035 RepID=A0ABR7ITG2_9CLOT|nr:sugar transferase [Massilioclostridium coli]MBC5788439.1 sugar transferase [Clostridium facile]PWM99680.1 MAG: sugar transferase [Massilioclostridium sp.]